MMCAREERYNIAAYLFEMFKKKKKEIKYDMKNLRTFICHPFLSSP
jgi:hypothetical protein